MGAKPSKRVPREEPIQPAFQRSQDVSPPARQNSQAPVPVAFKKSPNAPTPARMEEMKLFYDGLRKEATERPLSCYSFEKFVEYQSVYDELCELERSVLTPKYPMFAISLSAFVKLGKLIDHEDALKRGLLVNVSALSAEERAKMFVVFNSHQWPDPEGKDPDGVQYNVMVKYAQNIQCLLGKDIDIGAVLSKQAKDLNLDELRTSEYGTIKGMSNKKVYLWVDKLSIPQHASNFQSLQDSVDSLCHYSIACDSWIAIVPPTPNRNEKTRAAMPELNAATYSERGWCATECLARSTSGLRVQCTTTGADISAIGGGVAVVNMYGHESGGVGRLLPLQKSFTCCELDHTIGGRTVGCDRPRLALTMMACYARIITSQVRKGGLTPPPNASMQFLPGDSWFGNPFVKRWLEPSWGFACEMNDAIGGLLPKEYCSVVENRLPDVSRKDDIMLCYHCHRNERSCGHSLLEQLLVASHHDVLIVPDRSVQNPDW